MRLDKAERDEKLRLTEEFLLASRGENERLQLRLAEASEL